MIELKTSCDDRFIALARELGYDIYGENTVGGRTRPWCGITMKSTSAAWCRA